MKGIKPLTDKNYTEEFLTFFRTEQRQSNAMTSARGQPFCEKYNSNKGCFDGFRVCPRNITERNKASFMHKNRFCLTSKSDAIIFDKTIEELKLDFKVVDNIITD